MVPWSLRFYSLLGWRHFHRAEPVIKRSQSPSIAMQDTITHFDGSFVHLTNRVLSHKSLDCMQLNIFQSGGCLPICSIDDNMKWILFYTCIFFVPVRLLFFFLFFSRSLIVLLPSMCRSSFGYVLVKTLLRWRERVLST